MRSHFSAPMVPAMFGAGRGQTAEVGFVNLVVYQFEFLVGRESSRSLAGFVLDGVSPNQIDTTPSILMMTVYAADLSRSPHGDDTAFAGHLP
jgi:hypothetical protein